VGGHVKWTVRGARGADDLAGGPITYFRSSISSTVTLYKLYTFLFLMLPITKKSGADLG
jgi:hypothetical protein